MTVAVAAGPAFWAIAMARSRTAFATPLLALAALAALARWGGRLAARAKRAYWAGVAAVALAAAAVVGHGIAHGSLVHESLTFRWRYWVGSLALFRLHPLLGVGWDNFGPHYLGTRLPTATEEIRDPHNFVVRFFVELGLVGGVLMLAWMLRLWWEMTRPRPVVGSVVAGAPKPGAPAGDGGRDSVALEYRTANPPGRAAPDGGGSARVLGAAGVAAAGVFINAAASVDFGEVGGYVIIELFRRGLFLAALLAGMAAACLRARPELELDDRPAPWTLRAMVVGMGVFLVHNTIDFSLFEVGPLFLFMLLAGAVLGMRLPAGEPPPRRRRRAAWAFVAAAAAWLVTAGAVALPVGLAESAAQDGDEQVRLGRPAEGAAAMEKAYARVPTNADYAFRAARAWQTAAEAERAAATRGRPRPPPTGPAGCSTPPSPPSPSPRATAWPAPASSPSAPPPTCRAPPTT